MKKRRGFRRALRLAAVAFIIVVAVLGYLSRPAALRARLIATAGRAGLTVQSLESISYLPWRGLEINGLVLDGKSEPSDPTAERPPPLLSIGNARARFSLGAMLLGRLRVSELAIDDAVARVLGPRSDAPADLDADATAAFRSLHIDPTTIPPIRIKNSDIQVLAPVGDDVRLVRRWLIEARGDLLHASAASAPPAYELRVEQIGGPSAGPPSSNGGPPALFDVRLEPQRVDLSTGWIDVATARALLPGVVGNVIARHSIRGRFRLPRVEFDAAGLHAAEFEFADARAAIAFEAPPEKLPASQRYIQLRDATGRVKYDAHAFESDPINGETPRDSLAVTLDGALNDGTLHVSFVALAPTQAELHADPEADTGLRWDQLEFEAAGVDLPTLESHPAFVTSQALPGSIRAFFRKYEPRGPVNVRFTATRNPDDPEGSTFSGVFEPLDGKCRYFHFPYDVTNARGTVRFSNNGIVLDGLTAMHGSARIGLSGTLQSTDHFTGFDITVTGRNVALDRDLYDALPEEYHGLWREAAPLGVADIRAHIHRPHGSEELGEFKPTVEIDARLLAATLSLNEQQLERVTGELHIADGCIQIEDLHGQLGPASIRIRGNLADSTSERNRRDIYVEAANTEIRRNGALHDADGRSLGAFSCDGRGDVWGHLKTDADGAKHEAYTVRLMSGAIRGFDPTRCWNGASGWITMRDGRTQIHAITADGDNGWLRISGTLPSDGDPSDAHVQLDAGDERIDQLLQQLVPARWASIRQALGLGGEGKVAVDLANHTDDDGRRRQQANVTISAEHMKPTPIPLDLRDISAKLLLRDDGFVLHQADAKYGETGVIRMHGQGGWGPDGQWSDVGVEASEIELNEGFITALPKPLADLLARMAVRGRMNTRLDRLRLDRTADDSWDIRGRILLDSASLELGVPLKDFSGSLNGGCSIVKDRITVDASFAIDSGTLAGRPIAGWEGHLVHDEAARMVRIEDLSGSLCGGDISGEARIDPGSGAYELSANLHDLSFDELTRDPETGTGEPRSGRLDGRVWLRGVGADPATRDGGGELRVRNGTLLGSRVTASVVEASQKTSRPISSMIERAKVRFAWQGNRLLFNHVDISTKNMRLVGEGYWDTGDDTIDLTLIGAHPQDAPRLFLITDLIELAGRELLKYHIEGTAAAPHVSVEALHTLTTPVREMLSAYGPPD